eukprot:jgi/Undpi1/11970/HiC_scaffold_4.g01669.m1
MILSDWVRDATVLEETVTERETWSGRSGGGTCKGDEAGTSRSVVGRSALRRSAHPLGSPVASRSSSNDSWRQVIFEDCEEPPIGKTSEDGANVEDGAVAAATVMEIEAGGGEVGGVRVEEVDGMSVCELKLAATKVRLVWVVVVGVGVVGREGVGDGFVVGGDDGSFIGGGSGRDDGEWTETEEAPREAHSFVGGAILGISKAGRKQQLKSRVKEELARIAAAMVEKDCDVDGDGVIDGAIDGRVHDEEAKLKGGSDKGVSGEEGCGGSASDEASTTPNDKLSSEDDSKTLSRSTKFNRVGSSIAMISSESEEDKSEGVFHAAEAETTEAGGTALLPPGSPEALLEKGEVCTSSPEALLDGRGVTSDMTDPTVAAARLVDPTFLPEEGTGGSGAGELRDDIIESDPDAEGVAEGGGVAGTDVLRISDGGGKSGEALSEVGQPAVGGEEGEQREGLVEDEDADPAGVVGSDLRSAAAGLGHESEILPRGSHNTDVDDSDKLAKAEERTGGREEGEGLYGSALVDQGKEGRVGVGADNTCKQRQRLGEEGGINGGEIPAVRERVGEGGEEKGGHEDEGVATAHVSDGSEERRGVGGERKENEEKQEEEEEVVVPSAKELAEKFLEVVRLWTPILEKAVLNNNKPYPLEPENANTKTPSPIMELLPETLIFREKARDLSVWLRVRAAGDAIPFPRSPSPPWHPSPRSPSPPPVVGVSPGRRVSVGVTGWMGRGEGANRIGAAARQGAKRMAGGGGGGGGVGAGAAARRVSLARGGGGGGGGGLGGGRRVSVGVRGKGAGRVSVGGAGGFVVTPAVAKDKRPVPRSIAPKPTIASRAATAPRPAPTTTTATSSGNALRPRSRGLSGGSTGSGRGRVSVSGGGPTLSRGAKERISKARSSRMSLSPPRGMLAGSGGGRGREAPPSSSGRRSVSCLRPSAATSAAAAAAGGGRRRGVGDGGEPLSVSANFRGAGGNAPVSSSARGLGRGWGGASGAASARRMSGMGTVYAGASAAAAGAAAARARAVAVSVGTATTGPPRTSKATNSGSAAVPIKRNPLIMHSGATPRPPRVSMSRPPRMGPADGAASATTKATPKASLKGPQKVSLNGMSKTTLGRVPPKASLQGAPPKAMLKGVPPKEASFDGGVVKGAAREPVAMGVTRRRKGSVAGTVGALKESPGEMIFGDGGDGKVGGSSG